MPASTVKPGRYSGVRTFAVSSQAAQSRQVAALRRTLLGWYRRQARRLPWRQTRDPYAIWVAEVMLQQTQIATVIPYYRRFLQTFPSVAALARASLDRVLTVWSGMGYYRRARNLHRAAQAVVRDHGGLIPRDYEQARTLPGVGDYTARAVLSIAYHQPCAVLDGNVARVVARLKARKGNLHQRAFHNAVQAELEHLLSRRQPGDFNQAIMELGQTICLPRAPHCPSCPLQKWCQAYRAGNPEAYPLPRARRASELRHLAAAIIPRDTKVAMVRGLDEGLLGDLWNFPSSFGSSHAQALRHLRRKCDALFSGPVAIGGLLAELKHPITYRSIRVRVFAAQVSQPPAGEAVLWVPVDRVAGAPISQLARKIVSKALPNHP